MTQPLIHPIAASYMSAIEEVTDSFSNLVVDISFRARPSDIQQLRLIQQGLVHTIVVLVLLLVAVLVLAVFYLSYRVTRGLAKIIDAIFEKVLAFFGSSDEVKKKEIAKQKTGEKFEEVRKAVSSFAAKFWAKRREAEAATTTESERLALGVM
ncbi:hypothetical protein OF83DRAFT_1290792 [Amylostereum chailletii]|nr:hypothetical protein OF83DRAFT_1290792 [Amylostereum chailletii]